MSMNVGGIDLEVDPIEAKGLDQTQNSLAKESVDPKGCLVLIKECYD